MNFSSYDRKARRDIDEWVRGESSILARAFDLVMKPVDWAVEQAVPASVVAPVEEAIRQGLSALNDASKWTDDSTVLLARARERGLEVDEPEALRYQPLESLDPLAKGFFSQNAVLAALSGGGTGLGGFVLVAADIPILFMINFRLIQQIGAAFGFPMKSPEYSPLVLSIYNAAAANTRDARGAALREVTVAAAAFAGETDYKGRVRGTISDQSRHVPREIAKHLVGRKLLQTIPLAGAAVGAGINYWFTTETAKTTFMLFRALYLEHKERL